jgi:S-(hydroxymethyl)glutathione dehydrogenase/alcohol dehydrogenase
MKAALLHEIKEDLVIEDIDIDLPPRRDEVLVRTAACGVCHSDRGIQLGRRAKLDAPLVLGHEAAGIVEEVGSAVTYVKPGDPVVLCASAFCGTCRWCMRGQPQHCENKNHSRADGTPRLSRHGGPVEPFVGLGGFAEQMLVHERAVVKMPDDMPLDRAALLGCAVITGLGAARHAAGIRVGDTVAVIGCGGVGLNAIVGAAPSAKTEVRIRALDFLREKKLQGCVMGSASFRLDIPLYAQLYLDGRLKLDELLSEKVPLDTDGINTAMNQLDSPLVARAVMTP